MRYLKRYNESEEVPYWKQQQLKSDSKKALKLKYPDLGRVVFYKGEYGVLVETPNYEEGEDMCPLSIRWDTNKENDFEEFSGGNWMPDFIDNPYTFKYINTDGTLKNKKR